MTQVRENEQREKIKTALHASADEASAVVAAEVAVLIQTNSAAGRPTVPGLATGSTPVLLYRNLGLNVNVTWGGVFVFFGAITRGVYARHRRGNERPVA